jgi:hypothetical protein
MLVVGLFVIMVLRRWSRVTQQRAHAIAAAQ